MSPKETDKLNEEVPVDFLPAPEAESEPKPKKKSKPGSRKAKARKRELAERVAAKPLKDTAEKTKKAGLVGLVDIGELENVRPEYYGIEELAENIKEIGMIHPLIIRKTTQSPLTDEEKIAKTEAEKLVVKRQEFLDEHEGEEIKAPEEFVLTDTQKELLQRHGKKFDLVSGYRRKRALELLGKEKALAYMGDYDEREVAELMLSENTQRENLSPIAEARSMQRLVDLFGLTHAEVAQRLGVDRSHVSHRLSLLNLTPHVQQLVDEGKLTASHGEVLTILDEKQQERYADKAMTSEIGVNKLSGWVREIKEGNPASDEFPDEVRMPPPDVTQIGGIALRADLEENDYKKMLLYGTLRLFNDQQIVLLLEEKHDVPYEQLWNYVRELDEEEVDALLKLMAVRFVTSGHRIHTLEATLLDDLAVEDADAGYSTAPDKRTANEEIEKKLAPKSLEFDPDFHSKLIYPPKYTKPWKNPKKKGKDKKDTSTGDNAKIEPDEGNGEKKPF